METYKKTVLGCLDLFKSMWKPEQNWDYRTRETFKENEVCVEIEMGSNGHFILIYKRFHYSNVEGNVPLPSEAWKRIMLDMITGGIAHNYETTVQMHRDGRFGIFTNYSAKEIPLTLTETIK